MRYDRMTRRRRRAAESAHQRLDIQGLRMVAVLTVFANHLWGWPAGGFVGVDVFFVISGFLITGNLMRMAETTGNVSFTKFYWNRVRRIVPAATVVLLLTYLAAIFVFQPFRAHQIGVDALFAFAFLANWHFAFEGTDYFNQGLAVSPIQHYWSLSIEEQFYFVWPAVIFAIGVLAARKSWSHSRRVAVGGAVMALIVASSLAWAIYETATSPTWAYFNTFARVWELGFGALLAIGASRLATIPAAIKPTLSWVGLGLIAASLFLLHEGSAGFPAPWALLPIIGASLVIAAGVGGEPSYQEFLRNPVSTYIGDISYSLYLVHWPVIIIAGSLMDATLYYYIVVLGFSFGFAILSYHLVETPLRRADLARIRAAVKEIARREYHPARGSQYGAVAACGLLTVGLIGYVLQPPTPPLAVPDLTAATESGSPMELEQPQGGPLESALRGEIITSLQALEWPNFDPPADTVIGGEIAAPDVKGCGAPTPPSQCTWGAPDAATRAVLIGDSVAMAYLGPLRTIAENSGGKLQVHNEAQYFCYFIDTEISGADQQLADACPARKQRALDFINTQKPDVVFISHTYTGVRVASSGQVMTPKEWVDSMTSYIDQFRGSVKKIVFLAPPPADVLISDCYSKVLNRPGNCISKVTNNWRSLANAEQDLAARSGDTWVDPRPWFCASDRCPSFVGTILTKADAVHMSPPYGQRIAPVIDETLRSTGTY